MATGILIFTILPSIIQCMTFLSSTLNHFMGRGITYRLVLVMPKLWHHLGLGVDEYMTNTV